MPWWVVLLIIIGVFLLSGLFFSIFFTFFVSYMVYSKTLMRGKSGSWGREHCSEPGNVPLETMWVRGLEWQKENVSFTKELTIRSNDGLKLVGEWFDYGFDKTVIILPGRRETLVYSYFYSNPYKEAGVNVLVVDQRGHGLSEGKYSTGGIKEAEDVSLWMKYLHDELGQKEIILHGICVGTCCSTIVATKYKTDYLKAIILDSAFISYKEIYKNHYLESGHKLFPVFYQIWWWFKHYTKCDINESCPEKYMPEIKMPILFIWGTKDVYCLPDKSQQLYNACASRDKEIQWFEGATHSKVRLFDSERYDKVIRDFLTRKA